jgi:hypothetical protein
MKWLLLSSGILTSVSMVVACSSSGGTSSTGSGGAGTGAGSTTTATGATSSTTTSTTGTGTGSSSSTGTGGPTSTPGTVQCGNTVCDLTTDKCCIDAQQNGTCVPNDGMNTCATPSLVSMRCDDDADCGNNQVCCADVTGLSYYYACAAPAMGPQSSTCALGESCIPGGTCATSGLTCVTQPKSQTGAICASDHAAPDCGGTPCSGADPVCCWDPNQSTGTCVASGTICPGLTSTLRCTQPSDCGSGYACCLRFGTNDETFCAGNCDMNPVICAGASDCPALAPMCAEDQSGNLPAGVKSCQ